MMKGFGVELQAYDPFLPDSVFEEAGVKRLDTMEELFATSDIITVHTPLLPKTRHLVGKKQFDAIRKPVIFVCTSRGGVVDEEALKEAIDQGKVASAGLDVIEDETTFQSVLRGLPQVVMTPHTAYSSYEAEMDAGPSTWRTFWMFWKTGNSAENPQPGSGGKRPVLSELRIVFPEDQQGKAGASFAEAELLPLLPGI